MRPPALPVEGITRRGLLKVGLGLSGAALALSVTAAYAGMEAATGLFVTDYRLSPAVWPAGRRLTITVIADLHAGGPNTGLERLRQVVDSANLLGCDLVVLLGDYFATYRFVTERVPPPAWAGKLARLRAPLGVYAIYGNHDWWYDIAGVRDAFTNVRIPAMQNEAILLGEKGNRFWLAGLGDQLAHYISPGRFRGVDDLPATLAKVTTDDPVKLLVHEPDIFTRVPERVSLTLAGHTHGDRCAFRWCHRSGLRRNTVRASPMDSSSSVAVIWSCPPVSVAPRYRCGWACRRRSGASPSALDARATKNGAGRVVRRRRQTVSSFARTRCGRRAGAGCMASRPGPVPARPPRCRA